MEEWAPPNWEVEVHKGLLTALEERLGYTFQDPGLLRRALTHASYANETGGSVDNQRMEFLGDAVLGLAISGYLFEKFPNYPEGRLSRLRSRLVCEESLARRANHLKLGEGLLLGKGEYNSKGYTKASLLADACEATLAAIYLDGGYDATAAVILCMFRDDLDAIVKGEPLMGDFKTRLQEIIQAHADERPRYTITDTQGPPHARRFTAVVKVGSNVLGQGVGMSKKSAQQQAARTALDNLHESPWADSLEPKHQEDKKEEDQLPNPEKNPEQSDTSASMD